MSPREEDTCDVLHWSLARMCTLAHSRPQTHTHIRYTIARTGAETRKTGCAWLKKPIGVYGAFSVMFQFEIEGIEWDKVACVVVCVCGCECVCLCRCLWLSAFVPRPAPPSVSSTPRLGVCTPASLCVRRVPPAAQLEYLHDVAALRELLRRLRERERERERELY